MKCLQNGWLLLVVLLAAPLYAHTDLDLQIEEVSQQLAQHTNDVDLLLKRGDLQRRHDNRELALADFNRVREIQPENLLVNWFEGRLQVETGHPEKGVALLSRFLLDKPHHSIALQNRAQGYLLLEQPLMASRDLETVIRIAEKPAPSLYNAAASALVKAGVDHYSDAMKIVQEGLAQFHSEITLMGIGTDISLARQDTETATSLIGRLPAPLEKLPDWQFRRALLSCLSGQQAKASEWFAGASETEKTSYSHMNEFGQEWFAKLAQDSSIANCHAASGAWLSR